MLHPRSTIFFDLDGTLLDSMRGITGAINQALVAAGLESRPAAELSWCVGPPLRETFPKLLNTSEREVIERAVSDYRAAYSAGLMFENDIYPGIMELLSELEAREYEMFVLTAKPRVSAEKIIAHHGLRPYFRDVFGPELDGTFDKKSELLAHVLRTQAIDSNDSVVIGDRANDILAACANNVPGVGVTWGYGTAEELIEAGSFCLLNAPHSLWEILRPEIPFTE